MRFHVIAVFFCAGCGAPRAQGDRARESPAASAVSAAPAEAKPTATTSTAPAGMVYVEGGSFEMGANGDDDDSRPAHPASVDAFFIDRLEATAAEYEACVRAGACAAPKPDETAEFCNYGKAERRAHPINCIDHAEAAAFCAWKKRRLPSEAEWERAARGKDGRAWPWGNAAPKAQACWRRLESREGTCEVGTHPDGASPFGVQDMAGNVSEWTDSKFCKYSEASCDGTDLVGRGGSWDYANPDNLRTTFRAPAAADFRRDLLGVRCAQSALK